MRKDIKWLFLTLLPALMIVGGLLLVLGPRMAQTDWQVPQHIIVCLDAGHGGSDPGAVIHGRQEKDDNLRMALAVGKRLEQAGGGRITVLYTREDDSALELQQRVDIANQAEATLFVAFHRNTGGGRGVETWTSAQAEATEVQLAEYIQEALSQVPDTGDRGVKHGTAANPSVSYTVVGRTEMPACLIELGFMDNSVDAALFDSAFDRYADAVTDGILRMLELKSPS